MKHTLLLLLLAGCAERVGGTDVGFTLEVLPATQAVADPHGVTRQLDVGYLTVSKVALVACPSQARRLADWLYSSAHAHGDASPTAITVPYVVSLTAPSTLALGHLSPPAGRWCFLQLFFEPADADAVGAAEAQMEGEALHLRYADGADVHGADALSRTLRLDSLTLSEATLDATVTVKLDAQAWLQQVDPMAADAEWLALESIGPALSVDVVTR